MGMALNEALKRLEALSDERVRVRNKKNGAGDNQYGVKLGDIRKLAEQIKTNDGLAKELWETGNLDARLLAILLMNPKNLTRDELDQLVREGDFPQIADWLNAYIVKNHPEKETLREYWMDDPDPWAARAGWNLTSEKISKKAEGIDPRTLLDRIETEMGSAAPEAQWTMNFCLAGIGIHFASERERAIAIGEKLGIYRDYPVPKGCTSPFAPIWINEMIRRQGGA